ncbi:hypothetical protein [Curtobacterium sp. BRD11]|nr:hypothetical protein [Curtobacterium sp. BRD11]MDT0211543.1 hypothetical protein [Curtobacterium sp. BRD11]
MCASCVRSVIDTVRAHRPERCSPEDDRPALPRCTAVDGVRRELFDDDLP